MAYEYGYMSGYNPYTPAVAPAGYPSTPAMSQRPYMGAYGATSGVPQNTGMQTAQLPPAQTQQSNVPWIQVPNIEASRNVMVQPNQTAYMMNQNAPEFYVKSTDQMGVATIKYFRFQEFNPQEEAVRQAVSSQSSSFVTRDEFNQFANNIANQFSTLMSQPQQTTAPTVPLVPDNQANPKQTTQITKKAKEGQTTP